MNRLLLQNSLLLAGTTTALAVGFGLAAALWLATLEARWRNAFLALAIVSLALPPFLVTNCWINLLGETGVLRPWVPFRIYSLGGTIWILSLMLWPITLFAVLSAWRRLEAAQFECEPALAGFALLRWLLLPVARGELALAAVLTFVLALNNFAVPAILQTRVLPDELWVQFNTTFFQKPADGFDWVKMLRLSVPLVIAPILMLGWFTRRGVAWPRAEGAVSARVFRRQLGPTWRTGSGALALLLCVLSVVLPLAQIALAGRTWKELPGTVEAGTSATWNSFWFAALAATVVTGLGLASSAAFLRRKDAKNAARQSCNQRSADSLVRANLSHDWELADKAVRAPGKSSPQARILTSCSAEAPKGNAFFRLFSASFASLRSSLAWFPFFIPGVLLGIALIHLFNRPGLRTFYRSAGIVVLALVIRYFALGWTAARHAVAAADPDLTDAAKLEGASRWQIFGFVVWPQIAPQVLAAWYVVYLLCLWDVESMMLIVPPGGETLALRVFNLLHFGHNAQVNALCLTLLGLAVLPLGVWATWHWLNRSSQVLRVAWMPACVGLMLGGCSPEDDPRGNRIESRFFERAEVIGSRGVGVGEFNKPRSVVCDAQDNVYAVDMTGRVQKFSPDGKFLLTWQMPETTLGKAKGMGRDHEGNIIVIEPHYQRVNHYAPDGKLVAQWGCKGTQAGCFTLPRAVAVNARGEFFVSEYMGEERVQRFALPVQGSTSNTQRQPLTRPSATLSPSGGEGRVRGQRATGEFTGREDKAQESGDPSPLTPLPSDGRGEQPVDAPRLLEVIGKAGTGPGEFNRPEGICVDAQDQLYVADSCNHRIQIFSSDGKLVRVYGKAGSGRGELSYPYDIAVDAEGNQFVCEFGNSRIQVFNANCQPVEIIGGPGVEPGRFANPWALALDSQGNLYVADSQNHRVQKLVRSLKPKAQSLKSPGARETVGLQTSDFRLWTDSK